MEEKRDGSRFIPMFLDPDGTITPLHLQPREEGVGKTIPQRVDPSKVHVMTDEEIFHDKATRYCEQDTEASFSILESIIGATIHINVNNFVQNETDLHRKTASEMFHVPYDEVTPEQRQIAKDKNFIKCYSYRSSSHERGAEGPALGDGVDLEV